MITLPIYSTEGKELEQIKLNASVFDGVVNQEAIYQFITAFRANHRKGLASTKTRGEVSGGGKKPWRQKGTGRARVGSTRSPLWRHGGVVFGPHRRDFSYKIPQKIKSLALKSSLNAKIKDNNFLILEEFKIDKAKTKEATKILNNLKLIPKKPKASDNILLLLDKSYKEVNLSLRNIGFINSNRACDTNAYEVLSNKKLLITRAALTELTNRLK